jgi:glycosyltransferase involved in cell wall biosynthesis
MIVLLPVYQPGQQLPTLVAQLREAAPGIGVLVIDDGSGPASAPVLDAARDLGCTVLRHGANRGKGAALKTGFRHVIKVRPGHDVVSADADGQHRVADILRVVEQVGASGRMVLGTRRFEGTVPLRSRLGNTVTRLLFRAATGRPIHDTQTGLRGYPATLLPWLDSVPGDRFDYEMNVLLQATRAGHPIDETDIATTYLDDNATSHFGSLSDSVRVYRPLLRFAVSSLLTSSPCRRWAYGRGGRLHRP